MKDKKCISNVLETFINISKNVLQDNLVGVYLHGSAAMNCFNPNRSDIDLIVVVEKSLPDKTKKLFLDKLIPLYKKAPKKGIECSIIRKDVCHPFKYPTPYELHFSKEYLNWYASSSDDYIEKMQGTDKDLAAHINIINHYGKTLYGKEKELVFGSVGEDYYFDSLLYDISDSLNGITDNSTYYILNLCRVLAFKKEKLVLSKANGGKWGTKNLPSKYHSLISSALNEYENDQHYLLHEKTAKDFASYMLAIIKN